MRMTARWSRTIRVKAYESETLELSIDYGDVDESSREDDIGSVAGLARELAVAGDGLVAERLAMHASQTDPGPSRTTDAPRAVYTAPQAHGDEDAYLR